MIQYKDLVRRVLDEGQMTKNRTGVSALSLFGHLSSYDSSEHLPLVSCKKTNFDLVLGELLWFLSGNHNIKDPAMSGNKIWNEWASNSGSIGPMYGRKWRSWRCSNGSTIDQLQQCISLLKSNPNSRRAVLSAWDPELLPDEELSFESNVSDGKGALAECHILFQFRARPIVNADLVDSKTMTFFHQLGKPKYMLSLLMYQRSCDVAIGAPFNIASYSVLLKIVASLTGMMPWRFIHTIGDAHIYDNHRSSMEEVVKREHIENKCRLVVDPDVNHIDDFKIDSFELLDYESHSYVPLSICV